MFIRSGIIVDATMIAAPASLSTQMENGLLKCNRPRKENNGIFYILQTNPPKSIMDGAKEVEAHVYLNFFKNSINDFGFSSVFNSILAFIRKNISET